MYTENEYIEDNSLAINKGSKVHFYVISMKFLFKNIQREQVNYVATCTEYACCKQMFKISDLRLFCQHKECVRLLATRCWGPTTLIQFRDYSCVVLAGYETAITTRSPTLLKSKSLISFRLRKLHIRTQSGTSWMNRITS